MQFNFKSLLTIVPIFIAVVGGLYSSINYVSNLNNDLQGALRTIDVQAIQIKELQKDYASGREELVREMTNAFFASGPEINSNITKPKSPVVRKAS